MAFVPLRQVHCFRNCGETDGTIQFICTGATFDVFLEGLSAFTIPEDIQAIVDYSAKFGIFYPHCLHQWNIRGRCDRNYVQWKP